MWVLMVMALGGSTASTQSNLEQCELNFERANIPDVQQAYCQSAIGSDRIWIIKDGRRLVERGALLNR